MKVTLTKTVIDTYDTDTALLSTATLQYRNDTIIALDATEEPQWHPPGCNPPSKQP